MPERQLKPLPVRRQPVHREPIERLGIPIVIFVTVCAADRKPILANPVATSLIISTWQEAAAWLVGRYVILPDHIHLFCSSADTDVSLTSWVRYWKSTAGRRWPRRAEQPIWQLNFWDTQLRHGDSYDAKWEYVRLNPVRHGLVQAADDWPYAGELNALEWI